MSGWFEGRAPDEEDLEAVGDLSMEEVLYHFFAPASASQEGPSQGAAWEGQEAFYGLRGVVDGGGPSWEALKALSASGVVGLIHLRTMENDVIYSLKGDGTVKQTEKHFLL